MKLRTLCLILAAIMVLSLFPGTAMAENADKADTFMFTEQPVGGEVAEGEKLVVTWELNFTPVKLELRKAITSGTRPVYSTEELPVNVSFLRLTYGYDFYEIRAYYNETNYITSDRFYITQLTSLSLSGIVSGVQEGTDVRIYLIEEGLTEPAYEALLDPYGSYLIPGVVPGNYTIKAMANGYKTYTDTLTLKKNTTYDFTMEADGIYHTVTFYFGTSPIATQDVLHGNCASCPEDPYMEDYIFCGWYTDEGELFDFNTPITADLSLTAVFREMQITYCIYFYIGDELYDSQTVKVGDYAVEPEAPFIYGKIFLGWYKDDTLFDFSEPITNDIGLNAVFADAVYVSFYLHPDDEYPVAYHDVIPGETTTPIFEPAKEGKIFLGWYTFDDQEFDFSTPITEDVDLYAKFVDALCVYFFLHPADEYAVAYLEVAPGAITTPILDPAQEGKIFLGWYTFDGLKFDFSAPITEDVYVYAKFAVEAETDNSIVFNHTLNLASDISANFVISKALLADYDIASAYVEFEIDTYTGNDLTGTKTTKVSPVLNGNYYYFTFDGLNASMMNNDIRATFYGAKDGTMYKSNVDVYSVATYAYSSLDNPGRPESLKILCANLLRYGANAQSYKSYRTNALADSKMTDTHKAYLTALDSVVFDTINKANEDMADPSVSIIGKSLNLDSKVTLKFIVELKTYAGDVNDLTVVVNYTDINGVAKSATLTDPQVYDLANNRYSFEFDGLLAAELRQPLTVAVYHGSTRLSGTIEYSASTYGTGKLGDLKTLCQALMAYSDAAKAYFVG